MFFSRLSVSLHHSVYPSILGILLLNVISGALCVLKCGLDWGFVMSFGSFGLIILFISVSMSWEGEMGEYSFHTLDNLKLSLCLLVSSEVMLFVALLWAFFHYAFSPSVFVGSVWPPSGIVPINPMGVPLLSTLLLVSSGLSVTWAHHLVMGGVKGETLGALALTLGFGCVFLLNQMVELTQAAFTIGDSVLGSVLLVLTGFHGSHVLVGVLLLFIGGVRLYGFSFTGMSHTMLELSIWYWHLVDCVWLLVYSVIYWWGS